MQERVIFHIDVNSAFLSWESVYRLTVLHEEVDLRTIPSAIGGDEKKRRGLYWRSPFLPGSSAYVPGRAFWRPEGSARIYIWRLRIMNYTKGIPRHLWKF